VLGSIEQWGHLATIVIVNEVQVESFTSTKQLQTSGTTFIGLNISGACVYN
jgi:hypothetical protein